VVLLLVYAGEAKMEDVKVKKRDRKNLHVDQHVRGQQCSTLMQAFKMRMSGSTQSKATSSWGWLEGALKGFCEHHDLMTGDAIEFCRYAAAQVLAVRKASSGELPSLHQLPGLCGTVSAERWDQFETLFEKTTCNDFCVAKGLAPWKADDYVNTKQPLVYEDVCKGRVAIMNTKNDGIGGFVMGRLSTRAYALSIGALYVHMPVSPNHHLTGAKYKEKRNSSLEDANEMTLESMESFFNFGADELDVRTIKTKFSILGDGTQKKCGMIQTIGGVHRSSLAIMEQYMPEMRDRFRRHRVHPDLPWAPGQVYSVAVHLRRGDLIGNARFSRPVVSEAQLISGIEEVRKAVLISGENNGQPIVFHVFTQGEDDMPVLKARPDTTLHIAADTNTVRAHHNKVVPGNVGQELETAWYAFVMADLLLVGNSAFSVSASWLSEGWIWAFDHGGGGDDLPANTTIVKWEKGVDAVTVETVIPPRWPRQAGKTSGGEGQKMAVGGTTALPGKASSGRSTRRSGRLGASKLKRLIGR